MYICKNEYEEGCIQDWKLNADYTKSECCRVSVVCNRQRCKAKSSAKSVVGRQARFARRDVKGECKVAVSETKVVSVEVLWRHVMMLKWSDAKDIGWCHVQWCDGLSRAARASSRAARVRRAAGVSEVARRAVRLRRMEKRGCVSVCPSEGMLHDKHHIIGKKGCRLRIGLDEEIDGKKKFEYPQLVIVMHNSKGDPDECGMLSGQSSYSVVSS